MSKILAFLRRHKWSLPLASAAAFFFAHLASEISEGELDAFDASVARRVDAWRGSLDGVMLALTELGGPIGMSAVAAGLLGVLLLRRRWKEIRFGIVSAGGALLMNVVLKGFFQRARPGDLLYVLSTPTSFSFPSGHAMGSTGVLATLVVVVAVLDRSRARRALVITLASALVVGIALSRVYFGVHYPSDVLGGIVAGGAWVSAVTGWFYPRLLPGEASPPSDARAARIAHSRRTS